MSSGLALEKVDLSVFAQSTNDLPPNLTVVLAKASADGRNSGLFALVQE